MDPLQLVRFVKHGCVCFEKDDVVIYVDPYGLEDRPQDADLVIITHSHGDHYSPQDIARVKKEDTCFATTAEVSRLLQSDFEIDPDYITTVTSLSPTVVFECGAMVTPLVAENKHHPEGFGFGLLLEFGGVRWYLSGDTDVLDDDIRCDVLFVCCDGVWNMPGFQQTVPDQIAQMSRAPGLVIPYHYDEAENPGTGKNGAKLCEALRARGIRCKEWNGSKFVG